MRILQPGDEVIAGNDLYGGTYRLFVRVFQKYGIKFHYVDLLNAENMKPFISERSKMVWIETPTNPMLGIIDIAAVADICKTNGLRFCAFGMRKASWKVRTWPMASARVRGPERALMWPKVEEASGGVRWTVGTLLVTPPGVSLREHDLARTDGTLRKHGLPAPIQGPTVNTL